MRIEPFTIENTDLVKVGDEVEITESKLPYSWYYTVEPAVAMSGNYESKDRIRSRKGKVREFRQDGVLKHIMVEFDE